MEFIGETDHKTPVCGLYKEATKMGTEAYKTGMT